MSRQDGGSTCPDDVTSSGVAPFLSVRTAFDLYLKALGLPRGSLVVCSALTIPDMVSIFEEHGLVPLPVDLDPDTLAPEPGALEAEVERCARADGGQGAGRVRAIYIAHVFGAQVDMAPVLQISKRHGLLVWEDCAQVFTGRQGYLGHPGSDVVFFSFGVIKRATAFGGGVACVRDEAVLSAMLLAEAEYPTQSPTTYLRRVVKCSLLLLGSSPLLYGVIIHALRLMGIEHDKVVMNLSKGFPKTALLKAIRHRPSIPLLKILAWRIASYTPDGVEIRLRHCNRMLRLLDVATARHPQQGCNGPLELPVRGVRELLPGTLAHRHTLWLYPVIVKGGAAMADTLVETLLREGFDATRAPTSLMPIERCTTKRTEHSGGATPTSSSVTPRCSAMMDSLVYLPLCNNIPDSEWDRMGLVLAQALQSNGTVRSGDEAVVGSGSSKGQVRRRREVTQRLIGFALRLDVIVVSAIFVVLLLLFALVVSLF